MRRKLAWGDGDACFARFPFLYADQRSLNLIIGASSLQTEFGVVFVFTFACCYICDTVSPHARKRFITPENLVLGFAVRDYARQFATDISTA
ncbi:hypothetical protein [Janthinobacterium sp. RB2P8]|uniref:hypothetical protein n=1 Tax=Janthinobacterium sp. RB2P8 TaxID=3424191 RepID=UPI003F2185C0